MFKHYIDHLSKKINTPLLMNEQAGDTPFRPTNVFVLASCLGELTVQRAREKLYRMEYYNPKKHKAFNLRIIYYKDKKTSCTNN